MLKLLFLLSLLYQPVYIYIFFPSRQDIKCAGRANAGPNQQKIAKVSVVIIYQSSCACVAGLPDFLVATLSLDTLKPSIR